MGNEFRCQNCGRKLHGGEGLAGHRVLCPGCGTFSTVPPEEIDARVVAEEPQIVPETYEIVPEEPAAAANLETGNPFAADPFEADYFENPYVSPTQYGKTYYPQSVKADNRAVISFVLGLTGLFFLFSCFCAPLSLPMGIVGLILGIQSLESENRGFGVVGIVLCSIQLLLFLLFAVLTVLAMIDG